MWLMTMFDLPTDTKAARRAYSDFRKALLQDGFSMLQFSVYARHCPSEENAAVHESRVSMCLPPDGEVRLLLVTDKQYERMKVFHGKTRGLPEKASRQISFL